MDKLVTSPLGCFRGSMHLPDLGKITAKYDLRKKERIQCRKIFKNDQSLNPNLQEVEIYKNKGQLEAETEAETNTIEGDGPKGEKFISIVLNNEKKIERKIRSKSRLDSLFELCPMSPWRETSCLKYTPKDGSFITNLDFVNFYPSILITNAFPDPKALWHIYPKDLPREPGLLRCRMHISPNTNELVRNHHPFQLQVEKISCPFYLEGTIETLIHTNEIAIWGKYFEIEPIEAIISTKEIIHPLKNRVLNALEQIAELKKDKDRNLGKISELKLVVNSATTTPKINQPKDLPSKYGVHCFSSQIVSNARAILFDTIHSCLSPKDRLLQVNTDGFIMKADQDSEVYKKLKARNIWGQSPGQIREKCKAQNGLFLGANTWWLISKEGKLIDEAGTGRDKSKLANYTTIPKFLEYTNNKNEIQKIDLLYLSDFRHKLNHQTLERRKFVLSEEEKLEETAPWTITHREKERSWIVTKKTMNKFIRDFEGNHLVNE